MTMEGRLLLTGGRAAALIMLSLATVPGQCSELRAGVGRAAIPAPTQCNLAGFAPLKRRSTGVHDPLQATALVLRTATTSMALVACDLHSFQSKRVAAEAKRRWQIDLVALACSGSHSSPDGTGGWSGYEEWSRQAEESILRSIELANQSMFAARLGSSAVPIDIGYNWRAVDEEGRVSMLWRNPTRLPSGPLANQTSVWRIDDQTGALRAVIFHLGCRASAVGRRNLEVSADYPGIATASVETELGGGVVSLFLQGASGDVVPYSNEGTFRDARDIGETFGKSVARAVRSIATAPQPESSLDVFRDVHTFRERWDRKRPVAVETATIVLNRKLAFTTMPGAPFVEHQIALADRSPIAGTLLVGHTLTGNGEWGGILPTIRAAAEGGYGASGGETTLEVGAGEAMVNAALVNLYRAIGKLDDLPRGDLVRDTPPEGKKR